MKSWMTQVSSVGLALNWFKGPMCIFLVSVAEDNDYAVQAHMSWLQKQESFKQKFGDLNEKKDEGDWGVVVVWNHQL